MEIKDLEYRMYGFTPYQFKGSIHAGIQHEHALQRLNNRLRKGDLKDNKEYNEAFDKWSEQDETVIILNGGTTNNNKESKWYGTINQHADFLDSIGVINQRFHEPDLGDQLTAVVFLVDERVFDKKKYPDFYYYFRNSDKFKEISFEEFAAFNSTKTDEERKALYPESYNSWFELIGGEKNLQLRNLLKGKELN